MFSQAMELDTCNFSNLVVKQDKNNEWQYQLTCQQVHCPEIKIYRQKINPSLKGGSVFSREKPLEGYSISDGQFLQTNIETALNGLPVLFIFIYMDLYIKVKLKNKR